MDDVEKFRLFLENVGYQFKGNAGVKGRVFFVKGNEDLRTHYLHIEIFNGDLWKNHVYFRDYLRLNKKSIEEYSKLKKKLATKYGHDRNAYTNAKNDFIDSILKKANEEFSKE